MNVDLINCSDGAFIKDFVCKIGQNTRCLNGGCEWKKVFKTDCTNHIEIKYTPEHFRKPEHKEKSPTRKHFIGKIAGVRKTVYERDGYKCLKCGTQDNLTLDEVIPKSRGGKRSVKNCQTLCRSCNSRKGTDTTDYRKP